MLGIWGWITDAWRYDVIEHHWTVSITMSDTDSSVQCTVGGFFTMMSPDKSYSFICASMTSTRKSVHWRFQQWSHWMRSLQIRLCFEIFHNDVARGDRVSYRFGRASGFTQWRFSIVTICINQFIMSVLIVHSLGTHCYMSAWLNAEVDGVAPVEICSNILH